MKKPCLLWLATVASMIASLLLSPYIAAAAYPEKPVTLLVGFSAGGPTDLIARYFAESAKKYFPQPIVIVNRPGAGGALSTAETLQAKPDGYTLNFCTMSSLTIEPHRGNLPYNTPDQYTSIAMIHSFPFNMLVRSDAPWNSFKDFVEYARSNPGKVRVAHSGIGHITHLLMEQLKTQAKINLTLAPFPGGVEIIAAMLGGHIEATPIGAPSILPQVEAGKMKVLAIFDEIRNPFFPGVPTVRELGYNCTQTTYSVLIGPKGLPVDVVSKLQEASKKVGEDPAFVGSLKKIGVESRYENSKDVTKRLWDEYNLMGKVLEPLGLKKK